MKAISLTNEDFKPKLKALGGNTDYFTVHARKMQGDTLILHLFILVFGRAMRNAAENRTTSRLNDEEFFNYIS